MASQLEKPRTANPRAGEEQSTSCCTQLRAWDPRDPQGQLSHLPLLRESGASHPPWIVPELSITLHIQQPAKQQRRRPGENHQHGAATESAHSSSPWGRAGTHTGSHCVSATPGHTARTPHSSGSLPDPTPCSLRLGLGLAKFYHCSVTLNPAPHSAAPPVGSFTSSPGGQTGQAPGGPAQPGGCCHQPRGARGHSPAGGSTG